MPTTDLHKLIFPVALLLGMAAWFILWLSHGTSSAYFAAVSPPVLLYMMGAGAAWLIQRDRTKLRSIERVSYWFFLGVWLGAAAFGTVSNLVLLNLMILLVFAYLVFSTGNAWRAGLAAVVGKAAIGLFRFAFGLSAGQGLQELGTSFQNSLLLGILLLLLHVLAKNKDDYADSRVEAERLRIEAYQDVLTGLHNRRRLEEELDQEVAAAQRYERPLSLVLFDLDHFKSINDSLGHEAGDEVLQEVAALVQPLLRAGDIFGRWGGEEFLVITRETEAQEARKLAERLRVSIEAHRFSGARRVTASFGVSGRADAETPRQMLRLADEALYSAKRAGRNRTARIGQAGHSDPLAEQPAC